MSTSNLLKIAFAFVVSGMLLFFFGSFLGGRGFAINSRFQVKTMDDLNYYEFSDRDMEAFTSVNVDVSNIPVTVFLSQDGTYGVEMAYTAADSDKMTVSVEDGRLDIRKKSEIMWFSFDFSFFGGENTRNKEYVYIYLPEQKYETIEIYNRNSPVTVEETGAFTDKLILETTNGAITVSDIWAGNLKAETSNAPVKLDHITSKKVRVKTSNGIVGVEDSDITALDIKTSNGQVSLDGIVFEHEYGEGDISVDTSNAQILVYFPEYKEKDFHIKADTSNANIYINGHKLKNDDYASKEGKNKLRLKTSNGRIEMEFGAD